MKTDGAGPPMTPDTTSEPPFALIRKGLRSLVQEGLKAATLRAMHRTRRVYRSYLVKSSYGGSLEDRFTALYKSRYWGGDKHTESFSGPGSTLEYTQVLRRELPKLFDQFNIRSVFDAPCGDFKWMKHVLNECPGIKYIGADIVVPMIKANTARHANDRIRFFDADLTQAKFPKADLMICRDCLFHLSYQDLKLVLNNYLTSGIPLLLTSTHLGAVANRDIRSGDFRLIDLFATPFNFPKDVLYRIEDWIPPFPPREMCLWSRDQVVSALRSAGRPP
jgi:SAM-dependent methyltransferase